MWLVLMEILLLLFLHRLAPTLRNPFPVLFMIFITVFTFHVALTFRNSVNAAFYIEYGFRFIVCSLPFKKGEPKNGGGA